MKKMKMGLAYALTLFMVFSGIPHIGSVTVQAKKQVKAKTITLNKTNYTLKKGKKVKLKATILPKKSTQKKILWSSSKKKVATVSKTGEVKAKKNGTTIVTAKIKGTKKKASCKITVGTPVTSVKLSETTKQLKVGEKFNLKATVLPIKASVKSVDYSSSDKTIAEVTRLGQVTAKKAGTAVITVISKDGTNKKATCKIQVSEKQKNNTVQKPDQEQKPEESQKPEQSQKPENDVKIKRVTLNRKTMYIDTDSEPQQLKATVSPDNATNKNMIWTSEDEEIAKVSDNGLVTPGRKTGITNITATAADGSGKKASCRVTVSLGEEDPDEVYGDFKITKMQLNDFVEEATIEDSIINLKVASEDVENHLKEIIPEFKENNIKYRIEYDDFLSVYNIIISNDKGLEREYELSISIDYGNKYIKSFEKNENVTGYEIEENTIILCMRNSDLEDEDVIKTIKPQLASSTVKYKIVHVEEACEYRIILTDEDGSTRSYVLYVNTDNEKNNIINMKSKDSRVSKIEFKDEDIGNCIYIYGTAKSLDEIKDSFTYEFGEEVKSCSDIGFDEETGGGLIVLTSKYGGKNYYHVIYHYDYGTLNISKITSKNQEVVDQNSVEINSDSIWFNAKDIKEDIPYIIEHYFNFEYGKDTITGKLVKDGDDYAYVITDAETKETRTYSIHCEMKYSENYGVTGIVQEGETDYLINYDIFDDEIYISGSVESLDEILGEIRFQYGKDVISGEIKEGKYGDKSLVLTCKNGITREYRIAYMAFTEED